VVSPAELAYRCGILGLSFIACGAYLPADGECGRIREDWRRRGAIAGVAGMLATIASGRANPPPPAIEDARARDWLAGLCD